MPEKVLLPPVPDIGPPMLPLTERRGARFTQQEYDEALEKAALPLMRTALSAGPAAVGSPASLSLGNVLLQLLAGLLPESGMEGVAVATVPKHPVSSVSGFVTRRLLEPMRRGVNLEGFLAAPGGQLTPVEEMARHWNLAAAQGRTLPEMLKRGYVRTRGNGIEIHSLEAADPEALRAALQKAARNAPEVFVDSKTGSMAYDTAELAAAGWDVTKVRPFRQWLKEHLW